MEREDAAPRAVSMLCTGMVFALATSLLVAANWIIGGVDGASMRVEVFQPLAMFAVGVGVRFLGSVITRNAGRVLHVMVGDVAAVSIGLLAFFVVAAVQDEAKIVTVAAIIIAIVALPIAAIVSVIASGITRSRPALVITSIVSLCVLLGAVAVQGTSYGA